MKKTLIPFLMLLAVVFTGCMSSGSGGNDFEAAFERLEPKEQNLSVKELEDISLWKSTDQRIYVQDHSTADEIDYRPYNQWIASYEGFRLASLFGFDEQFSDDEMYQFIQALFEGMPMDVEVGNLVKSIVIPGWYDDGSPLVLNLTRAFTGEKIPTAVYMFNTWDNVRTYGLHLAKKAGVAYEYPRLKTPEGEFRKEFMDSYSISWLETGFVTASNSVGKELPDFSSASSDSEKLNMADDWIRDGDLDNDSEVLAVLSGIIEKDELDPVEKVFSRMQLFMYYLFHAEVDSAQSVINELNKSGLLEMPKVSESAVGILAKRDLQRILDIAIRLSESESL